jgi:hypothetical protein
VSPVPLSRLRAHPVQPGEDPVGPGAACAAWRFLPGPRDALDQHPVPERDMPEYGPVPHGPEYDLLYGEWHLTDCSTTPRRLVAECQPGDKMGT